MEQVASQDRSLSVPQGWTSRRGRCSIVNKEILASNWNTLEEFTIEETLPGGTVLSHRREVVASRNLSAVIPVCLTRRTTFLIEQLRLPALVASGLDRLVEVPSGRIDASESPEEAAKRELYEETGLTADTIEHVGTVFMSPALSTEQAYLFIALVENGDSPRSDTPEVMDAIGGIHQFTIGFDEVEDLMRSGAIMDGKTIILIDAVLRRFGRSGNFYNSDWRQER